MKRIVPLALAVLAFAAVPVAFADNSPPHNPPTPSQPSTPSTPAAQPAAGAAPLARLAARLHRLEVRFVRHCGTAASTAPSKCVAFAQRLEQRLHNLDSRIQQRIQKIQTTCTAGSTDPRCQHADRKIARLQRLDTLVQNFAAKLQDWLNA
jgi:hypothetical protein